MDAYPIVLGLHSYLRWAVLLLAVFVLVRALIGVTQKSEFTDLDRRSGLFLMISVDVQLLVGLVLYIWLSPVTHTAFSDFGAAMKNSVLRYFAVEHITVMIVAWILIHVGYSRVKKARTDLSKYRTALIFYGLALVLILSRIPWTDRPVLR